MDQGQKSVSNIDLKIPRFETQVVDFTDCSTNDPVELKWKTSFGIPDCFMIRVKQQIGNKSVEERNLFAKIESATLSIFDENSKLLSTVNSAQLQNFTRINSNIYARKTYNIVLLKRADLGNFRDPDQSRQLEFVFKLKEIAQSHALQDNSKQLIITPIYMQTQVMEGNIQHISIRNIYPEM
jgi:hypothetical protein